jgi:hypothetical protein
MKTTCKSIMSFVFISLLVALLFILTVMTHEAQAREWVKTFGGNNNDYGYSVQQTTDGGYIVVGSTASYGSGNIDVYLFKTNSFGNERWHETFGGNNNDEGRSVQQTTDGGYIIAGTTFSYGAGGSDVYIVKTDASGDEEWQRTFGGNNNDEGRSVQQTTDGGYIIVGDTRSYGAGGSNVYLVKTDASGNKVWQRTFGGGDDDYGWSVQQTTDGGYIIAGVTYSFSAGDSNVYLIKTDPYGNIDWHTTFGGNNNDYGYSVQQTFDGGYIIVGDTNSYGAGDYDVYLVKTDAYGYVVWQNTFGSWAYDSGRSVQQTTDGGYIIVGDTRSYGAGESDVYFIKTDAYGNIGWQETIGGDWLDECYSVQQTTDGGYIIVGDTNSYGSGDFDVYFIKTDESGNTD